MVNQIRQTSPIFTLPSDLMVSILEKAVFSSSNPSICFMNLLCTCKWWYDLCEGYRLYPLKDYFIAAYPSLSLYSNLTTKLSLDFQEKIHKVDQKKDLILNDPETADEQREEQISQLICFSSVNEKYLVQELDLAEKDFTVHELLDIVKQFPHLRKFKMDVNSLWAKHEFDKEIFESLMKSCPHLLSLTLLHSSLPTDAFVALKYCPQLEYIDLSYSKKIDGSIFLHLIEIPHLKKINLSYSSQVNDPSISIIEKLTLAWEELNVTYCCVNLSQEEFKTMLKLPSDFTLIKESDE